MTTLDPKALEAAYDAGIKAEDLFDAAEQDIITRPDLERFLQAAITTYLSALPAQPVAVKPLEWRKLSDAATSDTYGSRFIGHCAFGEYFVNSTAYGGSWYYSRLGYAHIECANEAEAKAAAQADYEARIRSAIAAPSQQEGVTEEMAVKAGFAIEERVGDFAHFSESFYTLLGREALEAALVDRDRPEPSK